MALGIERLPSDIDMMWPTLKVLEHLGGPASKSELLDGLAHHFELTDADLEIPHLNSGKGEFDYRAAWTRTRLRHIGAVDNPAKAVWTTETGKASPRSPMYARNTTG